MRLTCTLLLLFLIFSCSQNQRDTTFTEGDSVIPGANQIVDSSALYHGSPVAYQSQISFGLQNKTYSVLFSETDFLYSCSFSDSLGRHIWELNSNEFVEILNRTRVSFSANENSKKADNLKLTVFFATLPLSLKFENLDFTLFAEDRIDEKEYYGIETEVFTNVPLWLWINKNSYSLDYVAFKANAKSNEVTFKAAKNSRRVNGVIFQDYEVYQFLGEENLQNVLNRFKSNEFEPVYDFELDKLRVEDRQVSS